MTWISAGFLAILGVIFERRGIAHNWFTAAAWSAVALFPPITLNRTKWNTLDFWRRWSICALGHAAAMAILFGVLIPQKLKIGSIVVLPAAVEGLAIWLWTGGKWVRPHAAHRHDSSGIR